MLLATLILALLLLYVETRMTAYNMGAPWNGYGSVASTLNGKAYAPMQYRILVPWLCRLMPLKDKKAYYVVKGIGIWFMLYAFGLFCGAFGYTWWHGVLFLSAIMPVFFLFDYADCFYEFGFLASAFALSTQGQQHLVWLVPLTLLAALNRETGVFVPLGYYVLTGGLIGTAFLLGVFIVGVLIPRIWYGKKARYCQAVMFRRNIEDIRFRFHLEHILLISLLSWYVGLGIFAGVGDQLSGLYSLMGAFILVLAVPSVWYEIRVFMPVLIVTIPATLSIL